MQLHPASHLDHHLNDDQTVYIMQKFVNKHEFFIETIELPPEFGQVPCALYGPIAGDSPITSNVTYRRRGDRDWDSRILIGVAPRLTNKVTVIGGPHEEKCTACREEVRTLLCRCNGLKRVKYACILYTCYGGPAAPQEPGDPQCKDKAASEKFWSEHALAELER